MLADISCAGVERACRQRQRPRLRGPFQWLSDVSAPRRGTARLARLSRKVHGSGQILGRRDHSQRIRRGQRLDKGVYARLRPRSFEVQPSISAVTVPMSLRSTDLYT